MRWASGARQSPGAAGCQPVDGAHGVMRPTCAEINSENHYRINGGLRRADGVAASEPGEALRCLMRKGLGEFTRFSGWSAADGGTSRAPKLKQKKSRSCERLLKEN